MTVGDGRFMLSRDGAARREAALPHLRRVVRRRGAKRIATRAGVSVLLVAASLGVMLRWGSLGPVRPVPSGAPTGAGQIARGPIAPGPVANPGVERGALPAGAAPATGDTEGSGRGQAITSRIASVPASGSVLARVAVVDHAPSRVRFVGDQELIETFAASGRRVGVVHGQVRTGVAMSDPPTPGEG